MNFKALMNKKKFIFHPNNFNSMDAILILLDSICAIPLSVANEGTAISGNIIKVNWPNQDIHASATLVPWVIIKNTGAPVLRPVSTSNFRSKTQTTNGIVGLVGLRVS
jgi:hypothetical protein